MRTLCTTVAAVMLAGCSGESSDSAAIPLLLDVTSVTGHSTVNSLRMEPGSSLTYRSGNDPDVILSVDSDAATEDGMLRLTTIRSRLGVVDGRDCTDGGVASTCSGTSTINGRSVTYTITPVGPAGAYDLIIR